MGCDEMGWDGMEWGFWRCDSGARRLDQFQIQIVWMVVSCRGGHVGLYEGMD